MKSIVYFTDCTFFGGCENMLINFLSSENLNKSYDIKLFFNYSKAYDLELKKRIKDTKIQKKMVPLRQLYLFRVCLRLKNPFLRKLGILFESLVFRYPLFLYNTIYLYCVFRKHKIDLLHINNGGYPGARTCQAAILAASLCGIKNIIYVVNNLAFNYRHPSRWLDWPIDQLVKKRVSCFITGSNYAKTCLNKVLNLHEERFKVFANGVRLRAINRDRDSFLTYYQLSANSAAIGGVVAHLEERKGHIYLLKAMALLQALGRPMPLLLIEGAGLEKERLVTFVKANHLGNTVWFLGSIDHVFDLINAVDFTILPSISNEDFPNITIESMGLGKPVIGTKLAGIPEQIIHGETGLIVPPKNVDALADAIEYLTINTSLRNNMGEKARRRFEGNYTEPAAVGQYIGVYESLLGVEE